MTPSLMICQAAASSGTSTFIVTAVAMIHSALIVFFL
jgi:hypothetical protein